MKRETRFSRKITFRVNMLEKGKKQIFISDKNNNENSNCYVFSEFSLVLSFVVFLPLNFRENDPIID